MVCLGFEPGTKVLKVLTNPLGYCGPQKLCSVNPSWFAKDGYEEEEGDLSRAVGHACHKR